MIKSNEEKTWKACIYLRRSKSDNNTSNAIEYQRAMLLNFASRNPDICVVSILVDEGSTGINFDRVAFKDMIRHIEEGLIDCIIVKDFSRFGRDHLETGKYIEGYFTTKNVRFIAVDDDYDSLKDDITDSINSFLVPFKNIINEAFVEDISIRTKTQLEIKRKNGEFVSNFAVYGYIKQDKRLLVDEYAANIVKNIFDFKITGYNEAQIAKMLNTTGVLPPAEHKKATGISYYTPFAKSERTVWFPNTVKRVLSNRIYTGHLEQGKRTKINYKMKMFYYKSRETWNICKNTHESVIDELDFELVQELMNMDTRISKNSERLYLFSGFIICGLCGQSMTVKTTKKRTVKLTLIMFVPLIRKLENVRTITSANWHLTSLFCSLFKSR